MSALWTSDGIALATGGTASTAFEVFGVAFDSREIGPGDLFIAMAGETADGHDFIEKAFAAGAAGAIVAKPIDRPHVLVSDTMDALEALGRASRARMNGKVIGVTGSVGKTGTKEALAECLARQPGKKVHRSVKSYNNHTGVPLSLVRMPLDTDYAVFEMGMNHAGELSRLTRMVRPHVAIVTAIAPAHQEYFDSVEAIADAKAEVFEGLEPGGTAILPYDSPYRDRLATKARQHSDTVASFGSEGATAELIITAPASSGGTQVTARIGERQLSFTLAPPGDHWVSNSLAILAAVDAVGADLAQAGLALAELPGLPGRGQRLKVKAGDGTALIIDESYNANPVSMAATIKSLGEANAIRRIAVLGAMKELGSEGAAFHAGLLDPILAANVARVILVGTEMEPLATAISALPVDRQPALSHCADAASAEAILREELASGDAVLIKGSNAMCLGRIVAALSEGAA